MKHWNIKYKTTVLLVLLAMGVSTSCISDLDVEPIDPSVTQTFEQDGVFAKIYATLALTGQEGPAGRGDVDGIDEGTSAFVRLIWNLNELTTDEAICSWGDPGIPEMNFNRWSSSHDQITGVYGRFYFNVTLCNHFLEQTEGMTDEKTVKQRAETRFMRALNYFYLMDFFGNVPFTEVVATEAPKQISRADLFNYVEKELTECEADMYDPKQAPYYRADKAANWLLKSRLYLNAEVYTGTPKWSEAATYAKKVMDSAYKLNPEYTHLFMGDNSGSNVNKAPQEIILPIAADGIKTRSWGSSLFLIASTRTSGMPNWGSTEGWGGNRARATLVKKFFPDGNIPANAYVTPTTTGAADKRALFFVDPNDRTLEIQKVEIFKQGYSVMKYNNARADGASPGDTQFPDMDVPFLRAAEAYLTFAEATLRAGGSNDAALTAINALRTRANAPIFTTINLDRILDEKAREFYFEGHRRTDLIRYGYYGGGDYNWDWKGGSPSGTKFSEIYNLFPIPSTDMNSNENLKQNTGY
ncbi:MAG TPA: RagB/SusD family nutrient uptake outer membrane protein [Porphyromonadaceae bacterium]|nr:RagB/SusD family nutrient uptake outer membrane protein [Porphyromonadaceae bacterium]HBB01667.1 RagB/SusD family nutrient uptake outer membrane protein [Porphyromonadaceae bacterium]HCC17163.1 RagB/SusD family nutrient uptake outer membrane protein [Porphyromonadaceae bacterium]